MPHLVEMQEDFAPLGLTVCAITAADRATATAFAHQHGATYPIHYAAQPDIDAYGIDMIWGSPIYLVDPTGKVLRTGLKDSRKELQRAAAASR